MTVMSDLAVCRWCHSLSSPPGQAVLIKTLSRSQSSLRAVRAVGAVGAMRAMIAVLSRLISYVTSNDDLH